MNDPFFADNRGFVWLGIHDNERPNLKRALYSFIVVRELGIYPVTPDGGSFRVPGGWGNCRVYYLAGTSGDGAISCISPLPNSACFELTPARDEQIRFPCRPNPSDTVAWLWDWNDLPRSGGSIYAAKVGNVEYLHVYERTGTLTGQLDLSGVQPGDWLVPPD